MTTDWERSAERDPDHHSRMTAHNRAAAAMARDVPAVSQASVCGWCHAGVHDYHVVGVCVFCPCGDELKEGDEE